MVKLPPDEDTPEKRVSKIFDLMDNVSYDGHEYAKYSHQTYIQLDLNIRTRMVDYRWKNSKKDQRKIQQFCKL